MIDRHVDRKDLVPGRTNTCIVNERDNWRRRPNHEEVKGLLLNCFEYRPIVKGEAPYPIPDEVYKRLRCREFKGENITSEPLPWRFIINLKKVNGGGRAAINELEHYETVRPDERYRIKSTLSKLRHCNEIHFWIVHHVHPAKRP